MPTDSQIRVHSAAASIACALAVSASPLSGQHCETAAMVAGYSRAAARMGLRWAVDVGIVTRSYGPRNGRLYRLAGPSCKCGESPQTKINEGCAERSSRRSGVSDSDSPTTDSDVSQVSELTRHTRSKTAVVDLVAKRAERQ